MKLKNSAVLLTGASRGLGRALFRRLSEKGARVVGVARDQAPLERVVAEIRARGGAAHGLAFDVGDKQAAHLITGAASALVGPIDLLIHNASTLGPTPLRLLLDTECEDLEQVLAVNLIGPFRLTKIVAGSMALRGHGSVVQLSSDAAVAAYPRWGAYSVSKAALDHLGRLFAAELGELGVRVLSVDPGEMNTVMHAAALPDADPSTLGDPDDVAERIVQLIEADAPAPNGARISAAVSEAAS
jgi:NAD(P)-dependent dehydrogenase (short-subunit alcohol dehydrogenase family)